jgi:hypothetical protein
MEEAPKKHKIGWGMAIILLIAAGIGDLASLIPLVGTIVGPIFFAGVSIYMWKIGLGFVNARRLITMGLATVAEILPAVQELPAMLTGMAALLVLVYAQEKTGISVTNLAKGKAPLNSGGVRAPSGSVPPPLNSGGVRVPQGTQPPIMEEVRMTESEE